VESLKLYLPRDLLYKPINLDPSERFVMPTLLITQIAFRLAKIDLSIKAKAASLKENEYKYFRPLLGESLWQSHIDDRVVPNRLEQIWALSEQIYSAFQNPDPNSHSLFDYTTQNTTKGFFNMETCYQHGIERMQNLLAEEQRKKKRKNIQNEDNTQNEDNAQTNNDTQDENE
ncbi:30278_t:CDS:2, partial [Gigaspora margarita]